MSKHIHSIPSCLSQKALGQNTNTKYGLPRPYLSGRTKVRGGSVFAFVCFRKDLVLEQGGERRDRSFDGGISLIDGSNCGVIIKPLNDNVARRQRIQSRRVSGWTPHLGSSGCRVEGPPSGARQVCRPKMSGDSPVSFPMNPRPLDLIAHGESGTLQVLELIPSLRISDLLGLRSICVDDSAQSFPQT